MSRIENYEECILRMPREQQYSSCDELLFRVPALQKRRSRNSYTEDMKKLARTEILLMLFFA